MSAFGGKADMTGCPHIVWRGREATAPTVANVPLGSIGLDPRQSGTPHKADPCVDVLERYD